MRTTDRTPVTGLDAERLAPLRPMLRRYLFTLGAQALGIDDLVQETFVLALQKPFVDRGAAAVGGLLRAVAKNLLLRARRTAATRREVELAHEVWCEATGDGVGDRRVDALRACLEELPPRGRELLHGAYRDGLGRAELARRHGLRPEGIKTALRRLRNALQQCVERRRGTP